MSEMKENFRTANAILLKAASLVGGERARTHGDKSINHQNIADLWQAYLGCRDLSKQPINALDAAMMMVLLKVARTKTGVYNSDDYDDMAGYAGVSGEIAAKLSWAEK